MSLTSQQGRGDRRAAQRASSWGVVCACLVLYTSLAFASANDVSTALGDEDALPADAFAVVGGEVVSNAQFREFMAVNIRQRFYHGKVSHGQMAQAHQEITQALIDHVLLRQEAQRRNIVVDEGRVTSMMERVGVRLRGASIPEEDQQKHLESFKARFIGELLVEGLKEGMAREKEPSRAQVKAYYSANKDKFTTPPRSHLRLILLKVPPYAPVAQWQKSMGIGETLYEGLAGGADFAELAKTFSDHESASKGGDLGVVHNGMLSSQLQEVVDQLRVGEFSKPVSLLQGIAIVYLVNAYPSEVNGFEHVRTRARELLMRERKEAAWRTLIERLRADTTVRLSAKTN